VPLEEFRRALDEHPDAKAVCVVHAETSTGLHQPLPEIGELCRERGVLFLVDAVASLGAMEVRVDDWAIDVCYAGSQKGLGASPGLAPITFSERAVAAMEARARPPATFYLDAMLISRYVGGERLYHHTAPVSMLYGLHEALRLVLEEGLEPRWRRHQDVGARLLAMLEARGLRSVPPEGHRMPHLATVFLPEGWDDKALRGRLLSEFGIEIAGGFGELAGKVWRVGVMGGACSVEHVEALAQALDAILP
jgi:alanine-glyoxylate transaminase/serine-glyoxylate transaminase/serine-pyruvate transaminase